MNNPVIEKYMRISQQRAMNHVPFGEVCAYCLSRDGKAETSLTGSRCCNRCGAPMPRPICLFFGVPVYDFGDALEIFKLLPFSVATIE